ncbi:hypothetical protein ACFSOZ_25960 [Mesorhizobium newzealandense]|uniref:F5/8 type C domain-containing protein n=1 Tax=Mesorhizobium newzealandense TaxID=1300302 RepID=A0ABW4UFV8_9HYPH
MIDLPPDIPAIVRPLGDDVRQSMATQIERLARPRLERRASASHQFEATFPFPMVVPRSVSGSEIPTPAYTNSGGTGNRTSIITITTTATVGGGAVTGLIDGANASGSFWWTGGQSGREVKFDFITPKLITEITWYQGVNASHGTWQWQGSDDGSSWNSIGSTFSLGSGTTQVITTMSAQAVGYRYHRMLQTSGTTNQSPFLYEIEFKLAAY